MVGIGISECLDGTDVALPVLTGCMGGSVDLSFMLVSAELISNAKCEASLQGNLHKIGSKVVTRNVGSLGCIHFRCNN